MASAVHVATPVFSAPALSSATASCSSRVERSSTLRGSGGLAKSSFSGNSKPLRCAKVKHARRQVHAVRRDIVAVNGGPGRREGDQTSKQVLDAFFLGRALAETINERLGSALGELISEVSRRQAEQQQFVREFQSEVQSRAEAELEKAAKSVLWEPPTTPARASGKPSQTLTVTVVPPPIDPPSSESGTRDVPPSDIPPSI